MTDTRHLLGEPFKKETWFAIGGVLMAVGLIFILMGTIRWYNNQTLTITIHEVEPGVHCATMVTTDGAAIDCWKVK